MTLYTCNYISILFRQLQYTERNNAEHYYVIGSYPVELEKKVTLLKYFRAYMNEHLIRSGTGLKTQEGDEIARLPILNTWFRTKSAIILHLSNGTMQINFFHVSQTFIFSSQTIYFRTTIANSTAAISSTYTN